MYYITLVLLFVVSACTKKDEFDIFSPDFKVYVLLPSEGLGDRSFVDAIYEGVEAAKIDFKFSVDYIIPEDFSKGEVWINNIGDGSIDKESLIIVAGAQYTQAIESHKAGFDNHKVLFLGGKAGEANGLASITYRTYGASYIGGYLSARLKPNCRAAVIAAFDAPFLKEYQQGFTQGVIDAGGTVNPPAFISDDFSGFEMPDSAYRLTNSLLPENDLIFAMATGSNLGIINAARNYEEQRYVIGIDADQSWMGFTVVTGSVIKLFGKDIYDYINQFSRGNFSEGVFERTMDDDKTTFLINPMVLGDIEIPKSLIETAIEKENEYHIK
uniref:BMP family ABC transporter substrate-binding protein n=1 Tax=uncultured Draconibacterium sp. TaxID=1573823 RepID=UPI0032173D9F